MEQHDAIVGDGSIAKFNQDFITDLIIKHNYKRVLELGTHKGTSGESILKGLEITKGEYFHTVDIMDVNSKDTPKWAKYGPYVLPKDKFKNYNTFYFFHKDGSDVFFEANNNLKFDFIFIDGSHKKDYVKRDIINSFNCLEDGGQILLHDYFQDGLPKWEGRKAIMGIWEAVEELKAEGFKMKVNPITKIDNQKTTFCILER